MYSLNRMGGGLGPQQTRQFSTGPDRSFFKTMPTAPAFLNKINLENISSEKIFENPSLINRAKTTNVQLSCPKNLRLNPCRQLTELCSQIKMAPNSCSVPSNLTSYMPFNPEQMKKEDTQRKKEIRKTHQKHTRDHCRSPQKNHKNKMNINVKYDIDEVGVDVLSDDFESPNNTPTEDTKMPPIFVHEAIPEYKDKAYIIPSTPICITIESPVLVSINAEPRRRLPSECGSEDSFIVFQCSTDDGDQEEDDDDIFDEEFDFDNECETEDTDTEHSDDENSQHEGIDEVDFKETRRIISKKVTFANDLCKVYPMVKWSYAYRAARKGPWEEYGRDRCRFKDRISKMEKIINPVLKSDHRQKVYKERCL